MSQQYRSATVVAQLCANIYFFQDRFFYASAES
jgi:hypothetical protein